jgi:uncharacterized membrane protein YgcG
VLHMRRKIHAGETDQVHSMVRFKQDYPPKIRHLAFLLVAVAMMMPVWLLPLAMAAEPPVAAAAQAPMPQDKLDSLLAPIALYPDQLLTQALIASTYPLDVVEAARFVKANKDLKGEALDKAVLEKKWDPSVQSLTAFPQVLEMMNEKLEWTQELGDAFLANEKGVMQTVQRLRQKAEEAGNLKSNEQQKVAKDGDAIIIEPAKTEIVYVPTYNPTIVYGVWWAPMYPPYYWPPPPYYYPGYRPGGVFMVGFSIGWVIGVNHWGWCQPHWHGGSVNISVNRNNVFINNNNQFKAKVNNGSWQHNPAQRKGVAYRDASTRDQFNKMDANAVSARRDVRGYEPGSGGGGSRPQLDGGPATKDMQRPGSDMNRPQQGGSVGTMDQQRPGGINPSTGAKASPAYRNPESSRGPSQYSGAQPSFDSGQSRQQAQNYSNRGASSRSSMSRSGGGGGGRGGGRGR